MVFDWAAEDSFKTPQYYTYKLIETLLPKAMPKVSEKKARVFKLIELWASDATPRRGWLKVI